MAHLLQSMQEGTLLRRLVRTLPHPSCSKSLAKDDDGDVLLDDDDKNGDDGSQSKRRPKPKAKAATQKTAGKGKRPAAKTKK